MKGIAPALFSVPKAPPRTSVPAAEAEAFVHAETPTAYLSEEKTTSALPSPIVKTGMARLSVDVPCATLRALKICAIRQGMTVREYVLALLQRDGLTGE